MPQVQRANFQMYIYDTCKNNSVAPILDFWLSISVVFTYSQTLTCEQTLTHMQHIHSIKYTLHLPNDSQHGYNSANIKYENTNWLKTD